MFEVNQFFKNFPISNHKFAEALQVVAGEQTKLIASLTSSVQKEIEAIATLGLEIGKQTEADTISNLLLTHIAGVTNRSLANVAVVKDAVDTSLKAFA